MAFKPKPEEKKAGAPEFMNTYGDMVTLLLTFFVMLFAMSNINEEKFRALIESYSGMSSLIPGGGGDILTDNGAGLMPENAAPERVDSETPSDETEEFTGTEEEGLDGTSEEFMAGREAIEEQQQLNNLASDFKTYFAEHDETSGIKVDVTSEYVRFTFGDGMLFDSGSAELKPDAIPAIDLFAREMLKYPGHIVRVEGHTDNVPMSGANSLRYPSNRHLSSARADAVVVYLEEEKGIDSAILRAEGMGEHMPVDTNETPEGRRRNRRVEIKVYSTLSAGGSNFINN